MRKAFLKSNIYTQNIFFFKNAEVETIFFEHMLTMQSKVVKMSAVITNQEQMNMSKGLARRKCGTRKCARCSVNSLKSAFEDGNLLMLTIKIMPIHLYRIGHSILFLELCYITQ